MSLYQLHRYLGYLLILPVILWASTGAFFLVKPGYKNAYEQLQLTRYPLTTMQPLHSKPDWQDIAITQTLLGPHYRVKTDQGWQHIDPRNNSPLNEPNNADMLRLLQDAVKHNPARYGDVIVYQDGVAMTNTNVKIIVNWPTLSLRQQGSDSRFFNLMYDIHYLRWTGNKLFDQIFGYVGLLLLIMLATTGIVMIKKKPEC